MALGVRQDFVKRAIAVSKGREAFSRASFVQFTQNLDHPHDPFTLEYICGMPDPPAKKKSTKLPFRIPPKRTAIAWCTAAKY